MKILQCATYIPEESIQTGNFCIYGLDSKKNTHLRVAALFTATILSLFNAALYFTSLPFCSNLKENFQKTRQSIAFPKILLTTSSHDMPIPTSKIMQIAQKHLQPQQILCFSRNLATLPGGLSGGLAGELACALPRNFATLPEELACALPRIFGDFRGKKVLKLATILESLSEDQTVIFGIIFGRFSLQHLQPQQIFGLFRNFEPPLGERGFTLPGILGGFKKGEILELVTILASLSGYQGCALRRIMGYVSLQHLQPQQILGLFRNFATIPGELAFKLVTIFERLSENQFVKVVTILASFSGDQACALERIMGYVSLQHLQPQQILGLFRNFATIPGELALKLVTIFEKILGNQAVKLVTILASFSKKEALSLVIIFIKFPTKEACILAGWLEIFSSAQALRFFRVLTTVPIEIVHRIFINFTEFKSVEHLPLLVTMFKKLSATQATNLLTLLGKCNPMTCYSLIKLFEGRLIDEAVKLAKVFVCLPPGSFCLVRFFGIILPYGYTPLIKLFVGFSPTQAIILAKVFKGADERQMYWFLKMFESLPEDLACSLIRALANLPLEKGLAVAQKFISIPGDKAPLLVQVLAEAEAPGGYSLCSAADLVIHA